MDFLFNASMEKKKPEEKSICHPSSFLIFLQEGRKEKHQPISPQTNKGFINYVFCRNWAVRNPAGNRLDSSSLVNKQVAFAAGLWREYRTKNGLKLSARTNGI